MTQRMSDTLQLVVEFRPLSGIEMDQPFNVQSAQRMSDTL